MSSPAALSSTSSAAASVPDMLFLASGPILKKSEQPGAFFHRGMGTLIAMKDRAFIMTVAHLFTDIAEEYFFVMDNERGIAFKHRITPETIQQTGDTSFIEIGNFNSETGEMNLKTDSVAKPAFRLLNKPPGS